ncbi:hypothetical protein ACFXKS_15505 [Streptomyces scopuliridis]
MRPGPLRGTASSWRGSHA